MPTQLETERRTKNDKLKTRIIGLEFHRTMNVFVSPKKKIIHAP